MEGRGSISNKTLEEFFSAIKSTKNSTQAAEKLGYKRAAFTDELYRRGLEYNDLKDMSLEQLKKEQGDQFLKPNTRISIRELTAKQIYSAIKVANSNNHAAIMLGTYGTILATTLKNADMCFEDVRDKMTEAEFSKKYQFAYPKAPINTASPEKHPFEEPYWQEFLNDSDVPTTSIDITGAETQAPAQTEPTNTAASEQPSLKPTRKRYRSPFWKEHARKIQTQQNTATTPGAEQSDTAKKIDPTQGFL